MHGLERAKAVHATSRHVHFEAYYGLRDTTYAYGGAVMALAAATFVAVLRQTSPPPRL